MSIRLAQVVAVHPKRRTVNLVCLDNSMPLSEVNVMSGTIGSDCGVWDLPAVPKPATAAAVPALSGGGRSITAVIDFTPDGRPVVLGFLMPSGSQLAFTQDNRTIDRHASGAYTTVAPDGSMETFHPSGAYIRVGTGPHEDLTPLAANGNWSIPSGAAEPTVTVQTASFVLTVAPGGITTVTSKGTAKLSFQGSVEVDSQQDITLDATGNLILKAGGDCNITAAAINLN